jgi:uncharacterized 2Fe-2S/4Fe-4S cluster protein (DUF4445 family)
MLLADSNMDRVLKPGQADHAWVRFDPMGLSATVSKGTSIAEASNNLGILIRLECGGKGLCGQCRVIAEPISSFSPVTESERDILSLSEIRQSCRLACQARIEGDATITIPTQVIDRGEAIDKALLEDQYPVDPMVERIVLPEDKPPGHATDVKDWLVERAHSATGQHIRINELEALRQLSEVEIQGQPITLINHRERGVTAVISGVKERSLGVAIDIGTTTLASYLCDMRSGRVLAIAASFNPQRQYGEDVISRIAFTNKHSHGLQTLNELIVEAINYLIDRCLIQVKAVHEDIDEVTVVGNTTMERILVGFHPRGLGMAPYLPVIRSGLNLKAREIGLELNPGTNVFIFPVASGFLGGDTVSAIIADAILEREETCLLVDIGTNGELVLGNRNGLWATSCATGPALEGAQISCGMRAVSGAIYKVDIEPNSFQPKYRVIGENYDMPPMGVCGSGIIDAVAAMRRAGILMQNGRIKEGIPGVISDARGIAREFVLVSAEKSGTGKKISIKLSDIRQFQLAKSAILVGIELMMHHAGVSRVERTVLTGSFGARFDWRNALDIGLLPKSAFGDEVLSLENLAGVGAVLALLDRKQRQHAATVSNRVRVIDLAMDPEFASRFARGMVFPSLETS